MQVKLWVSHSPPSLLWNLLHQCFLFALVNTCYLLSCKHLLPQIEMQVPVCSSYRCDLTSDSQKSVSVHVGQTERVIEKLKFGRPSSTLSNRLCRCVCVSMLGFVHLFKPGLMGSRAAAAEGVSTDKRIWVSTCFGSDITMSFSQTAAKITKRRRGRDERQFREQE